MEDAQRKTEQEVAAGNLIAFMNRQKTKGDNRPVFNGEITLPNEIHKRPFSLWATQSRRTRESMLTGKAGFSAASQIAEHTSVPKGLEGADEDHERELEHEVDSPEQTLEADGPEATRAPTEMDVKENDLVLFTNAQRNAENPNRPDYWGYFNPGEGKEMMRLSVWMRTDRSGKAMLTGSVAPFGNALLKEKQTSLEEGHQPEAEDEKTYKRARAR